MTVEGIIDIAQAVLLCAGTALMALGVAGVLRMPDVYTRTQAASKTSTLGVALVFTAVAIGSWNLATVAQALGVIAFAFLSVPIGAHMITRAAHRSGIDPWPGDAVDELRRRGNGQ